MPRTAGQSERARLGRSVLTAGGIGLAIVTALAGISGSAFAVDCASANVTAAVVADAWIDEDSPFATKGTDSVLDVDGGSLNIDTGAVSGRARALVRFAMPSGIPAGCVVESARLVLFSTEESAGSRAEAVALSEGWTESTVSWGTQPSTHGAAVRIWSREGHMQWTVTAQVQEMLEGNGGHGFLIRDAGEASEEGAGGHGFYSREKGQAGTAPELVIRFSAPGTGEPAGPPEPPAAAEVVCGQVLTASTLVTNDLSGCLGDGLVIGAPRIIVDLGGHTIDGIGLGAGVRNEGFAEVTVRNGTIAEFDYGVQLFPETTLNAVEELTLRNIQVAAIELFDTSASSVRGNILEANAGGIDLVSGTRGVVVADNVITLNGKAGLFLRDAIANRLERNSIAGGGDLGIGLERASDNMLLSNRSANNSDGGIELRDRSHGNRLEGNVVTASGDHGIWINESDGSVLIGNVAHFMSDSGITLDTANDSVLRANDVRFNTGGLQLDDANRNLLENNDASETSGIGIELGGGSLGNLLEGNIANANKSQGIYVGDEALDESGILDPELGNVLVGNTTNGNGADGIGAPKAGHTLTANTARNNNGWGIYAALVGTTDGGLNVASGNDKPEQCQGVVCKADWTPPETHVTDHPPAFTRDTSATFRFGGSDNRSPVSDLTFACSLDAGPYVACTSPRRLASVPDGHHTFAVRATDGDENTDPSPATFTWTVDGTPPDTTITQAPPDPSNEADAQLRFTGSDNASPAADLAFECRLDGAAAWTACTSPHDLAAMAEGSHGVEVRAIDGAGNVDPTPATRTWRVDLTAPLTTIGDGPSDPTSAESATFQFFATEPAAFVCALDEADLVRCASPITYEALGEGSHSFTVQATDAAGNVEPVPAMVAWTVDRTPPETRIDAGPAPLTKATNASFAFSADEAAAFECSLDGSAFASCDAPAGYDRLGEGPHTFEVRATDTAGNTDDSPANVAWTIDTTPPNTSIGDGPADPTNDRDAELTFNGTDETSEPTALAFECRIDGGGWAACASPVMRAGLAEGSHTFAVRATDGAGNTDDSPATHAWTIDLTPPGTTVDMGPDDPTSATDATFAFSADEAANFACALDDEPFAPCESPAGYADLAEGGHTFSVRATDTAGNEEEFAAAVTWAVDLTAPEATIDSRPDTLSNSTTATFTFSADEVASFTCSLDGAEFASCTSPVEYIGLSEGSHAFGVRATDRAGNSDEPGATYAWIVDSTAPQTIVDDGPDNPSNATDASFTFSADEAATFHCSLDGADHAICTSPHGYNDLEDGDHTFEVRATDAYGNVDGTPASYDWTIDATAPQTSIDSGPEDPSSTSEASFTFSADEAATFACSLDSTGFATCTSPIEVAGLADGAHTFAVRATDTVGNQDGSPATYAWTVASGPDDTTPPETSIEAGPDTLTSATTAAFTFVANEPASFDCALDGAEFAACTSPTEYTGLGDGLHTFAVRAIDRGGNQDESPATYAWTIDTSAPETTISRAPNDPSSSRDATFTFSADESATFRCALDDDALAPCSSPAAYAGLADGDHRFEVLATDNAGNREGTPAMYVWTVDTSAPETTIDGGPSGPTSSTSATFTFSADEAATFACSLDGGAFAACSSPRQLTGLATGDHTLRVQASDAAGNTDGSPATRTWTVDTAAPNTSITSGPSGTVTSRSASFSFSATEAGSTFECSLDGTPFDGCTAPKQYSGLSIGGHTFRVRAIDPAGNTDPTPAARSWTIAGDSTPPNTTITSGPSGTVNDTTASFTFSASEAGSAFECSLDTAAFAACSSPQTYTGLSGGSHTFRVRAIDGSGNVDGTPATRTWTVEIITGCGPPITVAASADAWLEQNSPSSNRGADSILKVKSQGATDNFRAVVRFELPTLPDGCAVESATLRLFAASSVSGRSLEAHRLSTRWTESGVKWANQPATTGPAAVTASGTGYREWNVSDQLRAMLDLGVNHGFLIRDAAEGGTGAEQSFHARDKGESPPQLIIRLVEPSSSTLDDRIVVASGDPPLGLSTLV